MSIAFYCFYQQSPLTGISGFLIFLVLTKSLRKCLFREFGGLLGIEKTLDTIDMNEFNLYMKLAKPLALNMPDAKDRTTAARWLKRLSEIDKTETSTSDNIQVEYLKLLLFVMQGNQLTGIFSEPPPEGDLQEFSKLPKGQTQKASNMIALAREGNKNVASKVPKFSRDNPPVRRSISGDLCEYVAVQEIPNFGIHGYYALSTEALPNWWNPLTSAASNEPQISAPPCFKATCESARLDDETLDPSVDEDKQTGILKNAKKKTDTAKSSHFDCEDVRHGEKSLKKIFETQRNEIAGVETRPCWGRSRYIERLIDESPHLVGDLDLAEADALLNVYNDRKMRKIKKSGKEKSRSCLLSSRRRRVEAQLDMPPCAPIPVEEELTQPKEERTCCPHHINFHKSSCQDCCVGGLQDDYSCSGVESAATISLQGGGGSELSYLSDEYDDCNYSFR